MKTVISVASLLACVFSLDAQITTSLNALPDGSTELRMRNDSAVSLTAFAVAMNYVSPLRASNEPLMLYVDPVIDAFPAIGISADRTGMKSLPPNQEFTVLADHMVAMNPRAGKPVFGQPIVAGIFADGTTTGDEGLLTRLMLRRRSTLLAVETALEKLSDAGRQNITRGELIDQFKKLADSVNRWYLPPEQQIGLRVYQPIIGRLVNLPVRRDGSPDPLATFLAQETRVLRQRRVALSESEPSLAYAAPVGR